MGGSAGWVAEVEVGGGHTGHSRGSRQQFTTWFKRFQHFKNWQGCLSPLCLLLSGALTPSISGDKALLSLARDFLSLKFSFPPPGIVRLQE